MPEQQQATENNRQKPSESHDPKLLWDTIFPDTISFFTFWLGLFTGALALVSLPSTEFAEQGRANFGECSSSRQRFRRGGKTGWSDKTAERQLRAYVYNFPVSMIIFKPNEFNSVSLSISNHGVTPFRNGYVRFGFVVSPNDPENDYTVADDTMTSSKAPMALAGNMKPFPLRLSDNKRLSEDDFRKVQNGTHVIVIKGAFRYLDVFDIERHTYFNYSFSWEQMVAVANMAVKDGYIGGAGPAIYNKTGNYAD
jgi:hypothetical protein